MKLNRLLRPLALVLCLALVFSSIPLGLTAHADDAIIDGAAGDEEENVDIYAGSVDVSTADELEEALAKATRAIRIANDFRLDRTFYVISDTVIYAEEAHTLTRGDNFGGDLFVIGRYEDNTVCENTVLFYAGRDGSETPNLLTIDGNRDNMGTEVVGTVFFGCENADVQLYSGLTVQNCKKDGNERTLNGTYEVSYPARVGGAVAINAGGELSIYGGTFENNTVNDEIENDDPEIALRSTQGGAFYLYGTTNIYGGTFKNNHAQRGGAFYAYRTLNIYGATIEDNTSSTAGGAIYMPASGLSKVYIEGGNDLSESGIAFKNNKSETFGGAIYASGAVINIDQAGFSGNTAGTHGGAVYCSINGDEDSGAKLTVTNTTLENNTADYNGGAIYLTSSSAYMEEVTFKNNHAKATANANGDRYGGGALYSTGSYVEINGAAIQNNTSDNYGGGIEAHSQSKVVLNNITTSGNAAKSNGGFIFTNNSEIEIYNSAIRANTANNQGGAVFTTNLATFKAYLTTFESNSSTGNGGAILFYSGNEGSLLHSCVFLDNTSGSYGGGIYISKATTLEAYNTSAKGNHAAKGGFMYETTTGTTVTLNGLSVSGNTATDGGPIIWGNSAGAVLNINKSTYIDIDYEDVLDDAYWAAAIVNKLTVNEITDEVPGFINYGDSEETKPEDIINPNVTNVVELQAALTAGLKKITIISDFTINRTLFVNSDTTIYATGNRTLTRAPGFGGDMFVIGEAADGTFPEKEISVTIDPTGEGNSLTIDGNKDNMTTDVVGTVFFICHGARLSLMDSLTVQNCHKVGNERTQNEIYGVSYPVRIGGPVAINANSKLDIYGGTYKNNSVLDETDDNPDRISTQGGAIYSFGPTNIYGGTFSGNHAARGGFLYNYRKTNIHNAVIAENSASSLGGAIYMAASTGCYLYVGASTNICDSYVLFLDNTCAGSGGAIVSQGALTDIQNAEFIGNESGEQGGAIYVTMSELNKEKWNLKVANSTFDGNTATYNAGAVYLSKSSAQFKNVDFIENHALATANASGSRYGGGAVYTTGSYAVFEGVRFTDNVSDYHGGAVMFNSASEAVLYNVTATGNEAGSYGGFMYSKSTVDIYNSKINNSSATMGGALMLQAAAVTNVYSTVFDGNTCTQNGAAVGAYSDGGQNTFNNCVFKNNASDNFGGGMYISGSSLLDIYNSTGENNSAFRGGFLYITTTGTVVKLSDITISGNTASDGGPIIWGNSTGAKLYINKNKWTDRDASTLDSAYWTAAIVNKLKVYDLTDPAPDCDEYGNENYDNLKDFVEVSSSAELEAAINSGAKRIRVVSDFLLDRTFYITDDVTIFATTPYRLTRDENFTGDIFVVGEDKNGKNHLFGGGNTACLTLGNPESKTEDLLTIDGNKSNMKADVVGTVLFICHSANVNIYDNVSIVNARKLGNERTFFGRYFSSYPNRIGGAMAITESGALNVYGGHFKGLSVNDEIISAELGEDGRHSTLGGAIYSRGELNIYGGSFEYCYAPRGGAIYAYSISHIYGGDFINNHALNGGAVYAPSSVSVSTYIGGKTGETTVTFSGNSSSSNGGAIYSGAIAATVIYGDTLFENNSSQKSNGGAIYGAGVVLINNTTFKNNSAKSKGGAVFFTHSSNDYPVQEPTLIGCTLTGNSAATGGAVTAYSGGLSVDEGTRLTIEDCVMSDNEATGSGGAVCSAYRASINMKNTTLENNVAVNEGGAIYMLYEGVVNAENCDFIGNTAGDDTTGYGGAVSLHSSFFNGKENTFEKNESGLRGGALYVSYNSAVKVDSEVILKDSVFTENNCYSMGGAIYATDRLISYGEDENGDPLPKEDDGTTNLVLKDVSFTGNTASGKGGAMYLSSYTRTHMGNVIFDSNRITVDGGGCNAGAIYSNGRATYEINGGEFKNNYSGANGGALGLYSNSSAVLNDVTASGNTAVGDGGFALLDTAYITIYDSDISDNTAGSQGGAVSMVDLSTIHAYGTKFDRNSAPKEGGALHVYPGASQSVLNGCSFTENTSGTLGGAVYVANHTLLDLYNTTAVRNHANKGGFLYETTYDTVVKVNGLTVTGNTDDMGGPIIWGNTLNADLYINKGNYTDTEVSVLDDAYWAGAIYNLLTVYDLTDAVPEREVYKQAYVEPTEKEPIVHPEIAVEHIFELAENADHGKLNSTYAAFPRLDNSSNFMSRNTTLFPNINGEDVTVDSFIYQKNDPANNGNFGEGILIYQAMAYKRANPLEDVSISISSYRFSAHTAICIDRDSPYFGYMRALYDQDYDKFGFVRVSYLLLCAARMGIDVTVIGHIDGYPNTATSPMFGEHFTEMLDAPCDSTYTTGVIGDYMTFRDCEWDLSRKGSSDMMHTKLCAVSHYLDMNGEVHRNAVWTSSSNLDGINWNGTNGLNQLQTASIVSDHAEIFRISKNYLDFLAGYCGQEDVYIFRDVMIDRVEEQVAKIKAGLESEIPANEQIVYLGSENDKVFELYFSPFSGNVSGWEEEYNPFAKQIREMHNSEDSIIFIWNNVRWGEYSLRNQFEDVIIDAFHKNKNPENKIYVNLPAFNSAAFSDLAVGTDIGYKAFNQNDFGHVHSKDMHLSYVKDGQRYYVSVLNSMNVHSGSMAYQSNFALVIKETNCNEDSVFFTFADQTTTGIAEHAFEDTVLEYLPEDETIDGYTYHPCANCDERKIIGTIHRTGDWVAIKPATKNETGIAVRSCSACGILIETREYVHPGDDRTLDSEFFEGKTFTSERDLQSALSVNGAPLTIEANVQLDKGHNARGGVIVGNYMGSAQNLVNLEVYTGGRIRLYMKNDGQVIDHVFSTDIRSDSAVHIALTLDGTTAKLYLDSVLAETATLSGTAPTITGTMWIGGDNRYGNNQFFKGTIYSVSIFDHARSEAQISRDTIAVFNEAHGVMDSRYFSASKLMSTPGATFTEESAVALETFAATPHTIEATVKLNESFTGRAGVIVGNYSSTQSPALNLEINGGGKVRLYYIAADGTVADYVFGADIRGDEPVHVAVTLDGNEASLYVNGALSQTIKSAKPIGTSVHDFKVGGDNREGNTQYFKGIISNVALFSDVRTAEEIGSDILSVPSDSDALLYSESFSSTSSEAPFDVLKPEGLTFTQDTNISTEVLPTTPKTLEATIQLDKSFSGRAGVVVGNYDESWKNQMSLEIYYGGLVRIYVANTATTASYTFGTDIRSDSAVHVAVTLDGTTVKLYVNGKLCETGALSIAAPSFSKALRIGGDNRDGNGQYFKGTIYSVNLFDSVRTDEQIAADAIQVDSNTEGLIYSSRFATDIVDKSALNGITFDKESAISVDALTATPHTIEATVQLDKSYEQRGGVIVGNYKDVSLESMSLELYSYGRVRLYFGDDKRTPVDCIFGTDIRSDNPVHIAVTIDGAEASLYVDGVLAETKTLSSAPNLHTEGFKIGGDNREGNGQYFKDTIYNVSLFSDVRTAKEIAADIISVDEKAENLLYTTKLYKSSNSEIIPAIPVGENFSTQSSYTVGSLNATPHTYEAVVQLDSNYSGRGGVIVGNYSGRLENQLNLEIYTEGRPRLYYELASGDSANCVFDADIRSESAVHLAVTVDGLVATLYINGQQADQKPLTFSVPSITDGMKIGVDNRSVDPQYFKGKIYSVNLFSDVRSGDEIKNDVFALDADDEALLFSGIFTSDLCKQKGHALVTKTDIIGTADRDGLRHLECTVCGKTVSYIESPGVSEVITHKNWAEATGLKPSLESKGYAIDTVFDSTPRTIEAMIQLDKTYNLRAGVVLGNYDGSKANQLNVEIYTSGRPRLYYSIGASTYSYIFNTDIRSDKLTHMAITVDGLAAHLYVNGELRETMALKAALPDTVANLKIGHDNRTGTQQYFAGTIYSVNLFSDVRTAEEIALDRYLCPSQSEDMVLDVDFLDAE